MDDIAPRTGFICGTDLRYEMGESDMLGGCSITPNQGYAERKFSCSEECGLAEVEIRFVRWIIEPKL